ncbi:MAG: hypothetical protein WC843_06935 [Candidatus Gracilibacteria bacterium]|jgi:hypothetical protein
MFKPKTSPFNDIARQSANIVFAVSQIFTGYFLTYLNIGRSLQSQTEIAKTPVIPAGYAFSIWGFIFLFCLFYAFYQASPSKRENELLRKIGWFTTGAFLFNTAWVLVAQLVTFNWPTVLIIILILICSLGALFRLTDYKKTLTSVEKWVVALPVSVLAGWVSVATFANISSVLKQLQFNNFGLSETAFALLLLFVTGAFAKFAIYRSNGNALYGLAIIWALVAIIVANTNNDVVMVTAGAMILAIVLTVIFIKKQKKESFIEKYFGRFFA